MDDADATDSPRSGAGALFAMMVLVLALGLGAGVVQDFATDAAEDLVDGAAYSDAIETVPGYPLLEEAY